MRVSTRPGTTVEKIPPHVWHEAKQQVQKLADQNTQQPEKERIAQQLTQLLQKMSSRNVLQTNVPSYIEIRIRMGDEDDADAEIADRVAREYNDRLRQKISEFNQGLANLGDGISRLKDKLLAFEYRPRNHEVVDVNVYRNIHRNFRRILQKESRFLRDELFSAKDVIYRLERRSSSSRSVEDSVDQNANGKLIPYQEFQYHPTNFVNTETTAPQMWISPNIAHYPLYQDYGERLYYHPDIRMGRVETFPSARDTGQRVPICYNAMQIARPIPECTPLVKQESDENEEGTKSQQQLQQI